MSLALPFQQDPQRLSTAVVLSLIAHALLLSVALGGQTFGLPGLHFPWDARRSEVGDLRVTLAPLPVSVPVPSAPIISPAGDPAPPVSDPAPVISTPDAVAAPSLAAQSSSRAETTAPPPTPAKATVARPEVNLPTAPNAPPVRAAADKVESRQADPVDDATQKQAEQAAAAEQKQRVLEQQSEERRRQLEVAAQAARAAAEKQEIARQDMLRREAEQQAQARQETERAESARVAAMQKESARQEQLRQAQLETAARQETLKKDADRLEAARQEAVKQEAVRQDLAQQEAARQEAARQEAARQDAARREVARQEAARQESARQEAARQDVARQEAARLEAAKQESARQEAARQASANEAQAKQDQAQRDRAEQEAKREERLRAIGRQLNAEAAQRDAAANAPSPSRSLLPTPNSFRRGWLYGRADPNRDLVQYAENMGRKIEMDMTTFNTVRDTFKQPHARPVVTVAIRADGSVEKITFVVSSGVPAVDDAIRKVIATESPYGAFPPALARQFDVIEIRRTWVFDTAIRLE